VAPISTYLKATAIGVMFCFVYGLIAGGFFLIPALIAGRWPQWSWWQCLLAPLLIGVVAVAGELLVEPFTRRGREKSGQISSWRKAGRIGGLIALLVGFTFLWRVVF
jgi:hypothetical protein